MTYFSFGGELVKLNGEDRRTLDDLAVRFCSAKRIAFNKFIDGWTETEVLHYLAARPELALNYRYCLHSVKDAEAMIKSQKELLPLYLSDVYDKIEVAEKKVAKVNESNRKSKKNRLVRLEKELLQLNKRKTILEAHIAQGTIPKLVFGGRKQFEERAKGRISNAEWQAGRDDQIHSIAETHEKGNSNMRLDSDGRHIGINIPRLVEPRTTGRGMTRVRNERVWFDLNIPQAHQKYLDYLLASGLGYSIRITRNGDRYFASLTSKIYNTSLPSNASRVCSIDSNPKGFAAAIVKADGNLMGHEFFTDHRLIYAAENKRTQIVGELARNIIDYAERNGAQAIVLEDLNITKHKDFGVRGNRVVYAFVRQKFFSNMMIRCWKEEMPIFTVSPAYTSQIGERKYMGPRGLSVHEAAAFCIGRRFLGFGEKLSEPLQITVKDKNRKKKSKWAVQYVWPTIYSYRRPPDSRREPPRRKGSADEMTGGNNKAVFTGRPADESQPLSASNEVVRKGGKSREIRQTTGDLSKPAPPLGGGNRLAGLP